MKTFRERDRGTSTGCETKVIRRLEDDHVTHKTLASIIGGPVGTS